MDFFRKLHVVANIFNYWLFYIKWCRYEVFADFVWPLNLH